MDINEFELRYRAYKWLNHKFDLWWDQNMVLDMTKISSKWVPDRPIQDIWPEELHEITIETYTNKKREVIEKNQDNKLEFGTLAQYIDRLEYELKVIKEMWFNSYFLIVSDFVRWAKKNGIVVWPWRWSGAGSILAWLVRITDVDPLQFGLLFERFLNPARVSMPDFDIDFEDTQREKVIEYVKEKYWEEQVCSIWTYMQMATKAAFKDTARAIGLSFEKSNKFSTLMPDKMSISDALSSSDVGEEFKTMYESDELIQKAVNFSEKLEGNMRQLGMHACGVIIAPENITNYTSIQYVKEWETQVVSQYDGPTLETIWLLKMDFLGLRNLSVIKNCIKIISKKYEKEKKELPDMFKQFFVDTSFLPSIYDKFTFEKVFQSGDTTGIFQFESEGMRRFLVKLKADCIDDLVAMNALYRPGPMEFIPNYIDRKNGKEQITYMSDELRKILKENYDNDTAESENLKLIEDLWPIMNLTYGIAVYQEQLMFLVQSMAWFSLAEADLLRRWVGKKKKEVIEKLKKEFIKRAEEYKNYKKETSKYIYEKMIEPAASYSFNKSHSVCYAMIAYQTAYLKAHFPIEFYAALIRSVEEDTDGLSFYISETQSSWINVLSPDVNKSFNHVAAIDDNIRLGFFCVKWLGMDIWEYIQKERQDNGEYKSLEDFVTRCQSVMNKKSLEWLIKSGALDQFFDRWVLMFNLENILEWTKKSKDINMGLFGMMEDTNKITLKQADNITLMDKLLLEYDVFKCFVSGNPLDGLYPYLKQFSFISNFKNNEEAVGNFVFVGYIKNIKRAKKKWFFVQIEDISSNMEFFVKDMMDLKKFDILMVYGYKWKSFSVEKVVRTSLDKLIKNAWGRYNPEITVVKAKLLRKWNVDQVPVESEFIDWDDVEAKYESDLDVVGNQDDIWVQDLVFDLPDNVNLLGQVANIINEFKWDIDVSIWANSIRLSNEWVEKLKELLI